MSVNTANSLLIYPENAPLLFLLMEVPNVNYIFSFLLILIIFYAFLFFLFFPEKKKQKISEVKAGLEDAEALVPKKLS
jgi:cbb3-type cytochrome oxidase subunit 3